MSSISSEITYNRFYTRNYSDLSQSSKLLNVCFVGFSLLIMGVIGYLTNIVFGVMILNSDIPKVKGSSLYPRESETRELKSLDGLWNFCRSSRTNPREVEEQKWYLRELSQSCSTIKMAVPGSYNDQTQDAELRDFVGIVWYDRMFFIPQSWQGLRVLVRFGSVHYSSQVWVNGQLAVKHEFGHLPFEADISNIVKYGKENLITVLCDNVLLQDTIPQGSIYSEVLETGSRIQQSYTFDFFNYAGIHRSVILYTTPKTFIDDITVNTDILDTTGVIYYNVTVNTTITDNLKLYIEIIDKNEFLVANETTPFQHLSGEIHVPNARLWWPYLMNPEYGYLYTMKISLIEDNDTIDIYRLKVGIRKLYWDADTFTINGKPIYFHGFGKHEDSDIRGKGLDYPLLIKDFNLLKWVGANSFRTSHYPYSEETMQMADENGIMVIDECASVDTDHFTPVLLAKHKANLHELIRRDKNHASVIMWSIANEPRTSQLKADVYFKSVADFVRLLDSTRPVTAAIAVSVYDDVAAQHLDIISFNRYNAWYSNPGKLYSIQQKVMDEVCSWRRKHQKPVLISEYGADTMPGLHLDPPYVWSEEYQAAVFSNHFKAFDIVRNECHFIGEFVWNFADFKTAQTYTRVGGNKKGVFTRERQPKSAAHLLRQRYFLLSNALYGAETPDNLFPYIQSSDSSSQNALGGEL